MALARRSWLALLAVAATPFVAGLAMLALGYDNALTDLVLYPALTVVYLVTCVLGGRCIVC